MVVISGPFHPNLPWAPTRFTAPYREKKDLFIFCPPWAATKSCEAIRGGGIVTRAFLLLRPNFAISLTRVSGSGFLFWTIPPRLHRSGERRVGKVGDRKVRTRWSPINSKKKNNTE